MVDVDLGLGLFSQHREKAIAMYVDFDCEPHLNVRPGFCFIQHIVCS